MDLAARTLEALDWEFVAGALADQTRTSLGRRAALGMRPLDDLADITASFDAISEVQDLEQQRGIGLPPVGGVEDVFGLLDRAVRGDVLALPEIAVLRSTVAALAAVERFLSAQSAIAPTLAALGRPIRLDRRLCRTLEGALDDEGALSEASWPVLGELRRRIVSLERSLHAMLEQILESPEYADVLQDRYVTVRGDRFVVPVKAQAKGLGLGIVHDASRSERTVFVEPAAVVPIGNQRRMAEAELKDEERRILAELSALASEHAASLREALEAAAAIDLACARAAFAARLGAVRPNVGREGVVALREARHPVLVLAGAPVVANDLHLDAGRPVLVLTGPNAGGKTVAMKTVGLCALLVRAGCWVPAAPGSRIDLFDRVLADIGDQQTVHEGLSSFSAHLTTLREMLALAGRGSLLLLDEIAAGTDPAQGGALARAILERLADVGARVVATTHYTQVKSMGAHDERVEVAALEYRDGRPTYRVVAGAVGESHALAAAERVGLDPALVARALSLMEEGERALHDALAALDEERARAAEAARRLEAAEATLATRERDVETREREIHGRAREVERRAAAAVLGKLHAAEMEVRRTLAELREGATRQKAESARAAIGTAAEAAEAVRRDPAPRRAAQVGDRVRVLRLGAVGEVVAIREDEVEVVAGAMTVRAKPSEVEVVQAAAKVSTSPAKPRRAEQPAPPDWLESAMRSAGNTLDLRGVRVEDGIERLERFLDDAMLEGREFVFVLHGHGTGAMKSAVRRVLTASPYVNATAPAPEDQGGDALTVSRLRG